MEVKLLFWMAYFFEKIFDVLIYNILVFVKLHLVSQ